MYAFGAHFSAASVSRLLPSLKPLVWQSRSAPALQSGAPFAATRQAARPVTMVEGLRRDSPSPALRAASLAPALRSSMASPGLFRVGSVHQDLSNSFPISLNRQEFSSWAGGGEG